MSELIPTKKPAQLLQPLERSQADVAPRRSTAGAVGLEAQDATRAPGLQPAGGLGVGLAGMMRFKSRNAQLDGQPAAVVASRLSFLIREYAEIVDVLIGDVQQSMENAAGTPGGPLGNVVRTLTPGEAPNPHRWIQDLRAWQEARAMLVVARSTSDAPEGLKVRAKLVELALEKVRRAEEIDAEVRSGAAADVKRFGETALALHDGAALVRDISIAAAIAVGAIYFAPTLAGAGGAATAGGVVAPTTVGGTLAGAGKAAVLGATIGGTLQGAGTALGGGSLDQVGGAVAAGMRHGAVDGVMQPIGQAGRQALLSHLGPAAAAQGKAMEVVTRGVVGGVVGAPAGAVSASAKAATDGKSGAELDDALAGGATKGALKGATNGALR